MTIPERPYPLDTQNPWRLTEQPRISTGILRDPGLTWKGGPSFIAEETIRTIEQCARAEERYIQPLPPLTDAGLPRREPRWIPAAHETDLDMQLPDDWYGDTFTREGVVYPEDTGQFLVAYDEAAAEARAAEQRRAGPRMRRAIGRLAAALREQPPGAGVL